MIYNILFLFMKMNTSLYKYGYNESEKIRTVEVERVQNMFY